MFPYASAQVKTINARKHEIEQKQSGMLAFGFCYDACSAPEPKGAESCPLEMKANQSSYILIVFHQHNRDRKVRAINH